MRRDRGSGSILAVAIVAAVLCLTLLAEPLIAVLSAKQAVAGAADAAALAAADVAAGILPGIPCETAGRVAAANGAALATCDLNGAIATVTARTAVVGFVIAVSATAGPPGEGVK